MSAQELAVKYIAVMEKTLKGSQPKIAQITASQERIEEVFAYVRAYLDDAKYFFSQGKFETSLVSIAYCEGLLDALKLMGAVNVPAVEKQR